MYLTKKKLPISNTVKATANRLKYLSINVFIGAPNFQINPPIKKNLSPRLTIDAMTNITKSMLNTPEVMVNNLYGIGVNPAVKMIQKSYCS